MSLVAGALIVLAGCYSNNGGLIDLDGGVGGLGPMGPAPDGGVGGVGGDPGPGGAAGGGGVGGAAGTGGTAGTGGSGNSGGGALEGQWQPPEVIDSHQNPGLNPAVAMNADGRAAATWVTFAAGRFEVRAGTRTPFAGWSADIDLGETDGNSMDLNETSQPAVTMDPEGVATIAWGNFGDPVVRGILSTQYRPVVGWTADSTVYQGASTTGDASLATDDDGNVIAGFSTGTGAWGNAFDPDSGWGEAAIIDNERNQPIGVRVAMHPDGGGWASWIQAPSGLQFHAFANRFDAAGGFGEAFRVDGESLVSSFDVEVAAARNGDALFVWQQTSGLRFEVWSSRWSEEALENPERLSEGPGNASEPDIAIDDAGRGTAVWLQEGQTSVEIWAARHDPDTGWGAPERLASGDIRQEPRVAMDAAGNAIVAYVQKVEFEDFSDAWTRIYTAGGWQEPVRLGLDERTGPAFQPAVAMDPSGTAVVVWREGPDVWASVFE